MHYAFIDYAFLYDVALRIHSLCISLSFFYLFGYSSITLSVVPKCTKRDRHVVLGLFPQTMTFTQLLTLTL